MQTAQETVRKRFESDWLSGRRTSIEDYLPAADSALFLPTLEDLVCADLEFSWLKKPLQDASTFMTLPAEVSTRPMQVEDYLRRYPQLNAPDIVSRLVAQEVRVRVSAGSHPSLEEYRRRFPNEELDPTLFDEPTLQDAQSPAPPPSDLPRVFGGYMLIAELGRGGMGTVFRARQVAAQRDVAIKIAHVQGYSPSESLEVRQRFQAEARAAAALVHDNVVPVFDVGVVAGEPYYAMRLVEGGDLRTLSKNDPLDPRLAARYVLGATRGVASAHRAGLLHRDVKPQNILVDSSTDRAMITDFGLARSVLPDAGFTRTGQVLGTPQYMAPEQFRDSRNVDARADIYSLGATLYFLLTGRPPFQAANPNETMRQVLNEDPVSPRLINRDVDSDLDTICLKCLEKDPSGRYQTCGDLADDLARFLEGSPIVAKPLGRVAKLARWCRRNRALAVARGLLLLSMLGALAAILVGWRSTLFENRRFQASNRLSREALDELYVLITDDPLLSLPGMEATRKSMLAQALDYYRQLLALDQQDPRMRAARAFACSAMGDITLQLGQPLEEVEPHFQRALEEIDRLAEAQRKDVAVYTAKSNALLGLSQCAKRRGDSALARRLMADATAVRKQWAADFPDDAEARRKLANSLMNEGLLLASSLDAAGSSHNPSPDDAEQTRRAQQLQEEAKLLRETLLEADASNTKLKRDIARGEFNLAMLDVRLGRQEAAIEKLGRCEVMFRELVSDATIDWRAWRDLATTLITHGGLLAGRQGVQAQASVSKLVSEGHEMLRALIALDADKTGHALPLMEQYQQGIEALIQAGDLPIARAQWEHLAAEIQRTTPSDPGGKISSQAARLRFWSARQGALLTLGMEGRDAALAKLRDAIDLWNNRPPELNQDGQLVAAFEELTQLADRLRRGVKFN